MVKAKTTNIMMLLTKILIVKIFLCNIGFIINEEVEYYPSQSAVLSSLKNDVKRQVIEKCERSAQITKSNHSSPVKKHIWRNFNIPVSTKKDLKTTIKRAADPVFHGHPKTREELWNEHFLNESKAFDQNPSLIKLIYNITVTYLFDCTPVILYDNQVKEQESYLFQNLLKNFPVTFRHGYINESNKLAEPKLLVPDRDCIHIIIFVTNVQSIAKVLGKQSDRKVVVIARSSQWAVQEFLTGSFSRMFINLLIIGQSFKEDNDATLESPYILYTHKLYTDGLGASQPVVLNSWTHGKFSRAVNLFPPKMTEGYAGHRFVVAAGHQPPFVIRRIQSDADGGNPRVTWDGVEIRLLNLLAERNNFSIEITEPKELQNLGPGDAVAEEVALGRADIGVAGMYMTYERGRDMDTTFAHSQDCAVFITLMSTALPRYRAILGPFHWHVWVALTLTYLFGIFPLAFSDKHTLRHLLNDSGEIENMFWYVFGTFTNCFTFVGKNSWSKTTKITTRLLIGWYWLFTIIITSCYTGSIIAFVTLPIFPETVDSVQQLLSGFYRVGTLDRGGWEKWFVNSSDPMTRKLMKKLELVPTVAAGIKNTTKAFFWPHAFLGSKAELEYIVQANFTKEKAKSKRAMLHISNECFVPFGVVIGFPNNSLYTAKLSKDIGRMVQSGIIDKLTDEVRWEIQRSSTGKFLAASSDSLKVTSVEEKGLTLDDTQGMFLLLGAGFLMAVTALLSEWMGGFTKKCKSFGRKPKTASSTSRDNLIVTSLKNDDSEVEKTESSDRKFYFDSPSSTGSIDTLEGQIINVTSDNIIVHNNLDTDIWDSRRSSSVDLDKEVKAIFEIDQMRRMVSEKVINVAEVKDDEVVSVGAFGDRLK